jgi:hypothetical protein
VEANNIYEDKNINTIQYNDFVHIYKNIIANIDILNKLFHCRSGRVCGIGENI